MEALQAIELAVHLAAVRHWHQKALRKHLAIWQAIPKATTATEPSATADIASEATAAEAHKDAAAGVHRSRLQEIKEKWQQSQAIKEELDTISARIQTPIEPKVPSQDYKQNTAAISRLATAAANEAAGQDTCSKPSCRSDTATIGVEPAARDTMVSAPNAMHAAAPNAMHTAAPNARPFVISSSTHQLSTTVGADSRQAARIEVHRWQLLADAAISHYLHRSLTEGVRSWRKEALSRRAIKVANRLYHDVGTVHWVVQTLCCAIRHWKTCARIHPFLERRASMPMTIPRIKLMIQPLRFEQHCATNIRHLQPMADLDSYLGDSCKRLCKWGEVW